MFRYTRFTFRQGIEVHRETVEIDRERLDVLQQGGGELGFLRLLSNWNRVAARGGTRTGTIYIYCPETA